MKFLCLFFGIFILCLISAQNILAQKKGHVSLNGGIARPDSYYNGAGGDDGNLEDAEIGYNFQLSFNYRLVSFFGLSAMYHFQSNGIESFNYDNVYGFGSSWKASTGDLNVQGLFLGPLFSFKIYKELRLETRVMLSYARFSSPEVKLIDESTSTTETYTRPVKKARALTGLVGLGLKYSLYSKFCILLNVEYLSGRPDFSPIDFESPVYGRTGQYVLYSPPVISINYNIGFGFVF